MLTTTTNISDPRPFALHVRSLLQRFFGFAQGRLALGLGRSHRLELLALGTRSRLRLLFARADEGEVKSCGLGRALGLPRSPGLCLSNVVA